MTAALETPVLDDVERAAIWLANNGDHAPRSLLPFVRAEFTLSISDAIAAIRRANELRRRPA